MPSSGHLPGHVRQTFLDAIEAFVAWNDGEPEPTVEYDAGDYEMRVIPISRACGLVWNCGDIVPRPFFDWLADCSPAPQRQTYAACAHAMLAAIKDLTASPA